MLAPATGYEEPTRTRRHARSSRRANTLPSSPTGLMPFVEEFNLRADTKPITEVNRAERRCIDQKEL